MQKNYWCENMNGINIFICWETLTKKIWLSIKLKKVLCRVREGKLFHIRKSMEIKHWGSVSMSLPNSTTCPTPPPKKKSNWKSVFVTSQLFFFRAEGVAHISGDRQRVCQIVSDLVIHSPQLCQIISDLVYPRPIAVYYGNSSVLISNTFSRAIILQATHY